MSLAKIIYKLIELLGVTYLTVRVEPKFYTKIIAEKELILTVTFDWQYKNIRTEIKLREQKGPYYIESDIKLDEETMKEILEELRKYIERDYKVIESKRYKNVYRLVYELKESAAISRIEKLREYMNYLQSVYGVVRLI